MRSFGSQFEVEANMAQRNSYIRCTESEKEVIKAAIRQEFGTEPGSGIATGTALRHMVEQLYDEEEE